MEAVRPLMLSRYKTIVIGAGPAGLFCALNACAERDDVLLLEKNPGPGRKLLLSGSGQCNFSRTGPMGDFTGHYGSASNFVKPALLAFTNEDLCAFLETGGVKTFAREDGKLFPAGMRASDILALLQRLCVERGVRMLFDSPVEAVSWGEGGFDVTTGGAVFSSDSLVLATGGCSYPDTGSTGDGLALASSLGHTVTPITPSLTGITAREPFPVELAGISLKNSTIILEKADGKRLAGRGDVLFTGTGLSGPGILDLSRHISDGDRLWLALCEIPAGEVESSLIDALQSGGKKAVRTILKGLGIAERLADTVLSMAGIAPSRKGGEIGRTDRLKILGLVTAFPVTVAKKGDFRVAMATAGGVAREEVNRHTMESRKCAGLYFSGEVLDVDGDTGGYNIQWAFSSAMAAASAIRTAKR
jgi:hypothetical protein